MWTFTEEGFFSESVALNGNRFLLGNGYIGYRGTLEEFGPADQVGCMINGVYDRQGEKWREPVNLPNAFLVQLNCEGTLLHVRDAVAHRQTLDIRHAVHTRETSFASGVTIRSERFVSHDNVHLLCMKFTIKAERPVKLSLRTGADPEIWEINGPHFAERSFRRDGESVDFLAVTGELGTRVALSEVTCFDGITERGTETMRRAELEFRTPGEVSFTRYAAIYSSLDVPDPSAAAHRDAAAAAAAGYEKLRAAHEAKCDEFWRRSDVVIDGDEEAQFAMRYSLYHLMILATRHSSAVSIPARGLSGQVYKGAIFWDTEMFMLPFFNLTDPAVARNLILFRARTLDGARRKAAEYGFRGAYYAWESQETGDDACSHFNVPDVFSGRPMRTYFRDKQIHISADVVYGIVRYLRETGDRSVLREGALEVILECARFFYSYGYFKDEKNRFEVCDVTGPDEYHERVNNNAYTNKMVWVTLDAALSLAAELKTSDSAFYQELDRKINFSVELSRWQAMRDRLYLPQPDPSTGVIEQFDRYFALEDISLETLRSRILDPGEYLGGGNGLASSTQIIKQADVVLMLNLFKSEYDLDTIRRNWEFYEPRTEHGSSLSACAYSMTAAAVGNPEWAYGYFMKTATVDLTGKSKQFIGDLYIGGTHPAANGGCYLAAVHGFAGLNVAEDSIVLAPSFPAKWHRLSFPLTVRGKRFALEVSPAAVKVTADGGNQGAEEFVAFGRRLAVAPGKTMEFNR